VHRRDLEKKKKGGGGKEKRKKKKKAGLVAQEGHLVGPSEVAALKGRGVKESWVSREEGKGRRKKKAAPLVPARNVRTDAPFRRCNLFGRKGGREERGKNLIDSALTIATCPLQRPWSKAR